MALAILKDRFGNKEPIIGSVFAKLQNIPTASNRFNEIKCNHEVIEKILQQLQAQGESFADQKTLIQQLLCKMLIVMLVVKEINLLKPPQDL